MGKCGGLYQCNSGWLPLTRTDYHIFSLSMDNIKRPDLKRKLVVVGDGSSVSRTIYSRLLTVWGAKVAAERPVC